jgi:hypothetical protein
MLEVYLPDDAESPTVVLDRVDGTPSPLQKLQHLGGVIPPITVAEGVVTPDPFRDVIRTEPAPDLPSLIEDMMPYFLERHTSASTTPISTTFSKFFTTFTQNRKTTSAPITFTRVSTTTNKNVPVTPDLLGDHNNNRGQLEEHTSHAVDFDDEFNTEEDKDEDSGISLDSVLQFLFSNDDTTRAPSRATQKTTSYHLSSYSSTSQEIMATSHNTPATHSSQNSNEEGDKNEPENTTAQLIATPTNNDDAHRITTNSAAASTKFSTVSHTVLTTVSSNVSPTASSREPPPGKPPILQHPQLRAPVSADPVAASGLLKLAGCNIYGRMYRVGRIISELSGPCLECMCTEVGVQCRPLDC